MLSNKMDEYSNIDPSTCLNDTLKDCDEALIQNIHKLANLTNTTVLTYAPGMAFLTKTFEKCM